MVVRRPFLTSQKQVWILQQSLPVPVLPLSGTNYRMLSTPDGRSAGNAELMSPSRLVGPMALLLVLVPTTAGTMAMCAYPSSCSNGTAYHNSSQWRGKQLGNVTLDSPASLVGLICCSVAQGLGKQRSKNVTDGVPWSAQILGTSSKHKGECHGWNCVIRPPPAAADPRSCAPFFAYFRSVERALHRLRVRRLFEDRYGKSHSWLHTTSAAVATSATHM